VFLPPINRVDEQIIRVNHHMNVVMTVVTFNVAVFFCFRFFSYFFAFFSVVLIFFVSFIL